MFYTNPFRKHRAKTEALEESVGKTAGDKSYYNLQRAKDLAKKDGHDYDKLPQYDRTHDKHKDHYDARAKKEAMDPVSHKELKGKHKDRKDKDIDNDGDVDNSDKYLHKKRKAISKAVKNETFTISKASRKPRKPAIGGMQNKEQDAIRKDRMAKKSALNNDMSDNKIKEGTQKMSIREKLVAVLEGDRKSHYKSATAPEGLNDKSKSSKGAMDMLNTPVHVAADEYDMIRKDVVKMTANVPGKKMRKGDNPKGDSKIVPGGTPMKSPAALKKEEYMQSINGKSIKDLVNAISHVTEGIVSSTGKHGHAQHGLGDDEKKGHSSYMKKKHGVTTKYHGHDEISYHGTKNQVKGALDSHYGKDGDQKHLHPHIYK